MGELKPCPFCGGDADISQIGNEATKTRGYEVKCRTFGCSTTKRSMVVKHTLAKAREWAVERWNARPRTEGRGEGEPVASEDQANHDCLAKRRPGEPMFIILGRDPDGHNIVRSWAERRLAAGGDPEHCEMGLATAERMRLYASDPANAPASAPPASAYASPIREPEISREAVIEAIRQHVRTRYERREHHGAYHFSGLEAAADAILNLAPVGGRGEGWRPISEAPRDGSPILAASTNHAAREVVCWQDGPEVSIWGDEPLEGWVNDGEQKDRFYANPRWFTHWQPLPPPPQEQGADHGL